MRRSGVVRISVVIAATVILVSVGSFTACKRKFGASGKSFVGLSARLAGGGAPSFEAVSRWFQSALAVPGDPGAQALGDTPAPLRDGLVAYALQQIRIIRDFQQGLNDPRRMDQLLDRETQDLLELIVTLVDPTIRPQCSSDVLVKLVAQPGLREVMDQSARDVLDGIFSVDRVTLKREMPTERSNYLRNLKQAYLDPATGKANAALTQDLRRNCAWLMNFVAKAGMPQKSADACDADPQVAASGEAPLFFRLFDNVMRAMAASADWQRQNPGVNPYSYLNERGGSRGPGGMPYVPPLAPDWFRASIPSPEQLRCFEEWSRTMPVANLPPGLGIPGGACDGLRGRPEFAACMRNFNSFVPMQVLIPRAPVFPVVGPGTPAGPGLPMNPGSWRPQNQYPTSTVSLGIPAKQAFVDARRQAGETAGSNQMFLTTFAPPVLDQGGNGSCTAYAAVGSGWAAILPVQRDVNYDPEVQWDNQGYSPAYNDALSTAKETGVHGGATTLEKDVGALKTALDSGYPVYAACGTRDSEGNNTWNGFGTGDFTVRCNKQGDYGHAFWIGGYTTSPGNGIEFLIRNSWGSGWGKQGVARMPGEDVGNLSVAFAIDAGSGVQSRSSGGRRQGNVSGPVPESPVDDGSGEVPVQDGEGEP